VCRSDYGCAEGLRCDDTLCGVPPCAAGDVGCECLPGAACHAVAAVCADGVCQDPACIAGTEGCGCLEGGRCAGLSLVCDDGRCRRPDCPTGAVGCVCFDDGSCAARAECRDGWCVGESCVAGQAQCFCDAGTCGPGLHCLDDRICVDGAGFAGNRCLPGGSCRSGLACVAGVCTPCAEGALGCTCREADTCDGEHVCFAGRCLTRAAAERDPAGGDATCYTPCSGDLRRADGTIGVCSGDGLLDGCLAGHVCLVGTCVPEESTTVAPFAPRFLYTVVVPGAACAADTECAQHQSCHQGTCLSECDEEDDCDEGDVCYQAVCRTPCDLDATDACPADAECSPTPNNAGVCLPVSTGARGTPAPGAATGFVLFGADDLRFSAVRDSGVFYVLNPGVAPITVRVEKDHHVERHERPTDDARRTARVDGLPCDAHPLAICPLEWVELSLRLPGAEPETHAMRLSASLPGGCPAVVPCQTDADCSNADLRCDPAGFCACRPEAPRCASARACMAEVSLAGAADFDDDTLRTWEGELRVTIDAVDEARVPVRYSAGADGRWSGSVFYYANFEDRGVQDWIDAGRSADALYGVRNALVTQWAAFRDGRIDWKLFKAVLTATETESWRFPNVRDRCDEAACFLHDRGEGIGVYSSSTTTQPIPTGAIELPLVMNLTRAEDLGAPAAHVAIGRIDSRGTLHCPGDPEVTIVFADDPARCGDDPTCVTLLADFAARVDVGGRYATDAGDRRCRERPGDVYAPHATPWLVHGFAPPGHAESSALAPALQYETVPTTRYECRETRVPREPVGAAREAIRAQNVLAAGANPVPDGRERPRTLELIDGALVGEGELFILFREVSRSGPEEDITYGYLRLLRVPATLDRRDDDGDGLANAFDGNPPADLAPFDRELLGVSCSPALVSELLDAVAPELPPGVGCDERNVANCAPYMARMLLTGRARDPIEEIDPTTVHYLCVATGLLDGGPGVRSEVTAIPNTATCICRDVACNQCEDDYIQAIIGAGSDTDYPREATDGACTYLTRDGLCDDGGPGASSAICAFGTDVIDCGPRRPTDLAADCPADSEVVFFVVDPAKVTQDAIDAHACQVAGDAAAVLGGRPRGTCKAVLDAWIADGSVTALDPYWRCANEDQVYCDADRGDLRNGKRFFADPGGEGAYRPLRSAIAGAFRYKTQFLGRSQTGVGFVPEVCVGGGELRPYCYDPAEVQRTRDRVDCLVDLFQTHYDALASDRRVVADTRRFLVESFSYAADPSGRSATAADGFERLQAELLIMLGDEAFMRAFASRFDLAGVHLSDFQGTAFEGRDGIDLSGVAGYEMAKLHEAAQYFELVLDRFFRLLPHIRAAIGAARTPETAQRGFLSQGTVTTWLDRVARASTQRARVWSQIAQRYQNFGRPDLAQRVIERAYVTAYLESQVLARLLLSVTDVLSPAAKPQVRLSMEQTQRAYGIALLDMREVHAALSNDLNYFGFPDDYVPFPALADPNDQSTPLNAFEELLPVVQQKLAFAAAREDEALASGRDFDSDAASFQAELARIRDTYDDQLADLCGTFTVTGDDGADLVLPAVSRYAYRDDRLAVVGDPCGMLGSGAIHEAMAGVDGAALELDRVIQKQENTLARIDAQLAAMERECELTMGTADAVWEAQGRQIRLRELNRGMKIFIDTLKNALQLVATTQSLGGCDNVPIFCIDKKVASGVFLAAGVGVQALDLEVSILSALDEKSIELIDRKTAYFTTAGDCEVAQVHYRTTIFDLTLEMQLLGLDLLEAKRGLDLAGAKVKSLRDHAKRLERQREEAVDMAVDLAAARNDPNVRIYRNDAYVNADLAFYDALEAVYRLTRVYEYYTSDPYERLDELYLVRMVRRGDHNLENYLVALENAFLAYEETYGNADIRVLVVSLREDILRIPQLADGVARPRADVLADFRARLRDPARLDANGYVVLPFSTMLAELSPLTRNHKVFYIEADLKGRRSYLGDDLARVYLRQRGTGVVAALDGEERYFALPARTAVINAAVRGERPFDWRIYRSYRLRDRPLVNTQWELVLNFKDEAENGDIDIEGLSDVVLHVYYTDFTTL
jgi:hypothetical protein